MNRCKDLLRFELCNEETDLHGVNLPKWANILFPRKIRAPVTMVYIRNL